MLRVYRTRNRTANFINWEPPKSNSSSNFHLRLTYINLHMGFNYDYEYENYRRETQQSKLQRPGFGKFVLDGEKVTISNHLPVCMYDDILAIHIYKPCTIRFWGWPRIGTNRHLCTRLLAQEYLCIITAWPMRQNILPIHIKTPLCIKSTTLVYSIRLMNPVIYIISHQRPFPSRMLYNFTYNSLYFIMGLTCHPNKVPSLYCV